MENWIIPTTISIITGIVGFIFGVFKKQNEQYNAIKHGMQALLRNEMLKSYRKALSNGYTTIPDKQNFDNLYNNYHALGLNGVMDNIHDEYLKIKVVQ